MAAAALQAGLDRLPIGFALFDPKWRLVAWNAALASICGYPESFLAAGTRVEAFLRFNAERGDYGPGRPAALIRERLALLKGRKPMVREQRLADGRTLRISTRPVPPGHRLVTFEDVTAARLAEQRYDFASRAVNEGIYDWDIASGKIYYSERVYNALGFSPRDFRTAAGWRKRIHPDDLAQFDSGIIAHLKGKTDRFECDYRFRARDGSWRWARQHGIAIRDERGRALRMIGSTGDVTELKQTADALRTSEERYALAMRAATEGVYEWNLDTGKLYVSDTTKVFFWSKTDTLTPESWNERVHPDDVAGYRQAIVDHFKGRTPQFEREYRTRDAAGGYLWVLDRGIGVRNERGRVTKFVGAVSDVTRRKLAEQELRRAHKETTQALERQTATADILRVISASPTDVQPVLDAVAASAARLCEASDAIIQLKQGDVLHFSAHHGVIPNLPVGGTRQISRGTVSGRSVLEGRQFHIRDLQAEAEEFPDGSAFAREFGYRTILVTPLMREGTAIGTILIRRTEVRPFSDEQIALMQIFADQAVIAIENVRLFNETKEALEQQTATAGILKVISESPTNTKPVFDAIVQSGLKLFPDSLVLLAVPEGAQVRAAAIAHADPAMVERMRGRFPVPLSREWMHATAILDGELIDIPDAKAEVDGRHAAGVRNFLASGYRAATIAPMMRGDAAIGAISVSRLNPGPLSEKQVALLRTFAAQAVIAVENARLFNETKEALERQTATAEILKVMASSPSDVQPVFDAIAQSAFRLIGGFSTAVARVFDDVLHLVAFSSTGEAGNEALKGAFPMPVARSKAARTGTPVCIGDTEALPESAASLRELARVRGFRSIVIVPMLREGVATGTISVTRKEPGEFTNHHVDLLKTFADQAVIAIENVRLFNETKEALERQTATAAVLRVISASPNDLAPVFAEILDHATRLCEAEFGFVFTSDGQAFDPVAQRGLDTDQFAAWSAAFRPHRIPGRLSGLGRVLSTKAPVSIADIADDEAYRARDPLRVLTVEVIGARTFLAVPLIKQSAVIGSVVIYRREVRPFSHKQVALLQTFADQAVIAIENVRLFNETKEALERQTATSEILNVIAGSPSNVQPVFDAIAKSALRLVGGLSAAVTRIVGEMRHLAAFTTTDEQGDEALKSVFPAPVSRGFVGRAIEARAPVFVSDIETDPEASPEFRELARARRYRSVIFVPMLRDEAVVGTISVTRREPGPFSDHHINLLKTFADQAVIAIENARLFNETKEALERQTATAEILKVISSSPTDTQPVFDAIVQSALKVFDGLSVGLLLVDNGVLTRPAFGLGGGLSEDSADDLFPIPIRDDVMAGRAVLRGETVHVSDIEAASWLSDVSRRWAERTGARAEIVTPMMREAKAIGAIAVVRAKPGEFNEHQVALLQTFADQAVIAIENVRLFQELQQSNREISDSLEQQTATSEILRVISSSPTDTQPVFEAIAASALRLFGGLYVAVMLARGTQIELVAAEGTSDVVAKVKDAFPIPLDRESVTGRTIVDRAVQNIPDMSAPELPEFARVLSARAGVRALLGAPMLREGAAIGAIMLFRDHPGEFREKHVSLLQTFADQAVIAIENVRLFNETKEALARQAAATQVLRSISESVSDTAPVFTAILECCNRLIPSIDYVQVQLIEGADRVRLVDHRFGQVRGAAPGKQDERRAELMAREAAHFPRPLAGSTLERALNQGRVVILADTLDGPDTPPGTLVEARRWGHSYSQITVPLMREGRCIGAIEAFRRQLGGFEAKESSLLESFADQAVIAIENVRLFNETKESLERQTATAEILRVISASPTDVQPVFDAIAESAVRLFPPCNAAILMLEDGLLHSRSVKSPSGRGVDEAAIRELFPMPIEKSFALGAAIQQRRIVEIEDTEAAGTPPEAQRISRAFDTRSVTLVPLMREASAIGGIAISSPTPGRKLNEKQIALLKTFADQAVIAIENVRLFKELQSRTEALTKSVGQLTALGEVGQAISSTLDLETVLKTIVQRAVQLTGVDGGSIYEYDESAEVFSLQAAEKIEPELVEAVRKTPVRKGEGAIGTSAVTLEPTQVADILDDSYQTVRKEILVRAGYRAILAVPLVRDDHLIGALQVFRRTAGGFAPEVIELLKTFATQSAMAIQNARLFREIAEKGRQLEVASQHKSQFLASMSHELRTPLNAILGFNEMILDEVYGELTQDLRAPLENMQTSGKHLLRLINNVLDLAKIEAGRMELALSDYSVQDTVASVHSTLKPLAADKGLEFLASVPNDIPLAYGDGGRIAQCLMNLAGNSLKFTKAGKVEIGVEQKDSLLLYRVADTGIGIPPEKIGSLFTEFKQTDATIASEYGGTGLGLSITKKFIEMHGGRIWVESEPGKGSTFLFEIPLRAAQ